MTRRAAIAALAAFAAFSQARGEWVTEVVTNRVEYDGVEYLQSSGTQYIDTGIRGNEATDRMKIDVSPVTIVGNTRWVADDAISGEVFAFEIYFSGNSIWGSRYRGAWAQYPTLDAPAVGVRQVVTYNGYGEGFSVRDVSSGVVKAVSIQGSSTDKNISTHTTKVFGTVTTNPRPVAKLYAFSLERFTNGAFNLLVNLIPVLDGTTPKMLNLVDGQLFGNAGSGSFTYGAVTGKVAYVSITTNRVYRAPAPMRSFDAAHPFNAPTARTRLGGTGSGEDGTTLRPTAHFDIKRNEED